MRALEALTNGLFDYAGMFPPAELGFQEALTESAGFATRLQRPELVGADMVILPEHLNEATTQHMLDAGFHRGSHVRMCLVGVPAHDGHKRANQILAYNRESRFDKVPHEVIALEVHSDIAADPMDTAGSLMPGRFALAGQDIQVYWEPKLTDAEWQERFDDVWAVVDGCNNEAELPIVGLKVRCAGPHAVSPATMARIIPEIAKRTLPFKATQGLHHPFARDDFPLGFLSLATALRLAEAGAMDGDIEACLSERDPAAFDFASGLAWRDVSIDLGRLGAALETPFSIGSCSLQEPDDDLAALF